jgi:hypothetical protein
MNIPEELARVLSNPPFGRGVVDGRNRALPFHSLTISVPAMVRMTFAKA